MSLTDTIKAISIGSSIIIGKAAMDLISPNIAFAQAVLDSITDSSYVQTVPIPEEEMVVFPDSNYINPDILDFTKHFDAEGLTNMIRFLKSVGYSKQNKSYFVVAQKALRKGEGRVQGDNNPENLNNIARNLTELADFAREKKIPEGSPQYNLIVEDQGVDYLMTMTHLISGNEIKDRNKMSEGDSIYFCTWDPEILEKLEKIGYSEANKLMAIAADVAFVYNTYFTITGGGAQASREKNQADLDLDNKRKTSLYDMIEYQEQLMKQVKETGKESQELRDKFEKTKLDYEKSVREQEERFKDDTERLKAVNLMSQGKIDSLTGKIDTVQDELQKMQAKYDSVNVLYNTALDSINTLNTTINKLEGEGRLSDEEKARLTGELNQALKDKEDLEKTIIPGLRNEINDWKFKHHIADSTALFWDSTAQAWILNARNLEEQLKDLKDSEFKHFIFGANYDKYGDDWIPKIVLGLEYKRFGIGAMFGWGKFSEGPFTEERINGSIDDPYHQRIVMTTSSGGNSYVLDFFVPVKIGKGFTAELIAEYGKDNGKIKVVKDLYQGTPRGEKDPIHQTTYSPSESENWGYKFGLTKKIGKHWGVHGNLGYAKKEYSVGGGVRVFR